MGASSNGVRHSFAPLFLVFLSRYHVGLPAYAVDQEQHVLWPFLSASTHATNTSHWQ